MKPGRISFTKFLRGNDTGKGSFLRRELHFDGSKNRIQKKPGRTNSVLPGRNLHNDPAVPPALKNGFLHTIFPLNSLTRIHVLTYSAVLPCGLTCSTSLLQSVPITFSSKQRSQSVTLYSCRRLKIRVSFIALI